MPSLPAVHDTEPQIEIRLRLDTLTAIDRLADRDHITRTAWIRRCIETASDWYTTVLEDLIAVARSNSRTEASLERLPNGHGLDLIVAGKRRLSIGEDYDGGNTLWGWTWTRYVWQPGYADTTNDGPWREESSGAAPVGQSERVRDVLAVFLRR